MSFLCFLEACLAQIQASVLAWRIYAEISSCEINRKISNDFNEAESHPNAFALHT